MASTYSNLFALLGGDEGEHEGEDVSLLYDRMKKKAVEEVPSSPTKTRKEYIVFAEKSEHIDSKEAHVNRNENGTKSDEEGWQIVSKKVRVKKVQENGNVLANGDGSEQTKGNGNGHGGRKGRYGNGDNGEVKDLSHGGNGDGVDAAHSNVNSEGDAAVTVESSNDKEIEQKETAEEVKSDVPEPEETAEERKERVRKEQLRKEKEERRRLWIQEAAEEAKKMTLDQYEQTLLKKKQALNLQKAEARRVASANEDFENMKLVGKKKDNDETRIVEKEKPKGKAALVKSRSEGKLKKSESFDKGLKPLADSLAKQFRPASFRGDRSGQGRGQGNQGGFGRRFPSQNGSSSDGSQRNNGPSDAADEALKYKLQFPVLGSVPQEPTSESFAPPANPSTSSGLNSSESSAPPANPSTLSGPNSSESSAPPANPSTSLGPNSAEPSSRRP